MEDDGSGLNQGQVVFHGAEMQAGCNAFKPSLVSNPGWFASIYSADTPEIGLSAALVGQPEM